jgi:hypothetical protein
VHPTNIATDPAAAEKSYVLTLSKLDELVATMRQFYMELALSTARGEALERVCAELLDKHKLRPATFANHFLTLFIRGGSVKK